MARFKVRIGSKTMLLGDGDYDVGRLADSWLTLDDELASRQHARIRVRGDTADVEDLGSRNGTFVNGTRIEGARALHDGDKIRIGRELIVVLRSDASLDEGEEDIRRTLAPGEDTRFPSLIGQLVDKSLKVGKIKEAERYATALTNQLSGARVSVDHPAAAACINCLLGIAEHASSGVWIDRVFVLHESQRWVMPLELVERIRVSLDRIPRVPGGGIRAYEQLLRELQRDGVSDVTPGLVATVAELADAYAQS